MPAVHPFAPPSWPPASPAHASDAAMLAAIHRRTDAQERTLSSMDKRLKRKAAPRAGKPLATHPMADNGERSHGRATGLALRTHRPGRAARGNASRALRHQGSPL